MSRDVYLRHGGGGIFIRLNDGRTIHKYSTNDKAEADALRTAASTLMDNVETVHTKVVIFSDALSVPQALPTPRNKELNHLVTALHSLQQSTEKTAIQGIPWHCNVPGNEEADRLAKEGGKLPSRGYLGTATSQATKRQTGWRRKGGNCHRKKTKSTVMRQKP